MARFAPFEAAPCLAVAVSGGADSTALLLLSDAWVRALAGSLLVLSVDHGLRPEARDEAVAVATLAHRLGHEHRILTWQHDDGVPAAGIQARARVARYRLLAAACREAGVLHLLTAHHRDDQVETILLRMEARSGPAGEAGIQPVLHLPDLRVLRPLLDVPKARLVATVEAAGERWAEDPSNRDPHYARIRLRRAIQARQGRGLPHQVTGPAIEAARRHRHAAERSLAAMAARVVRLHPLGYARLDRAGLTAGPAGAKAVLEAVTVCVGGRTRAGRSVRAAALGQVLAHETGVMTLNGCIIRWNRHTVLIAREAANLPAPVELTGAGSYLWDNRYLLIRRNGGGRLRVAPLGSSFEDLEPADRRRFAAEVPVDARAALPALWADHGDSWRLIAVPATNGGWIGCACTAVSWIFRPTHPIVGWPAVLV